MSSRLERELLRQFKASDWDTAKDAVEGIDLNELLKVAGLWDLFSACEAFIEADQMSRGLDHSLSDVLKAGVLSVRKAQAAIAKTKGAVA